MPGFPSERTGDFLTFCLGYFVKSFRLTLPEYFGNPVPDFPWLCWDVEGYWPFSKLDSSSRPSSMRRCFYSLSLLAQSGRQATIFIPGAAFTFPFHTPTRALLLKQGGAQTLFCCWNCFSLGNHLLREIPRHTDPMTSFSEIVLLESNSAPFRLPARTVRFPFFCVVGLLDPGHLFWPIPR